MTKRDTIFSLKYSSEVKTKRLAEKKLKFRMKEKENNTVEQLTVRNKTYQSHETYQLWTENSEKWHETYQILTPLTGNE